MMDDDGKCIEIIVKNAATKKIQNFENFV